MNANFKTILLTVLTLSLFTIALIELGGISKTAFFNKYDVGNASEKEEQRKSNEPKTIIAFDNMTHDFGKVKNHDTVYYIYNFKNTGSNPLIIKEVIASCGCTVPSFTKAPVAPGKSGQIKIQFHPVKAENADKKILVKSNAQDEMITLNFKASVQP